MADSRGKKCCNLFLLEWHYSKLWFFHHDWKIFLYTPWLPYKWYFQIIYLAYRWIMAFYFFGWLVYSGVDWGRANYFIFLTNWIFLLFNAYLIIAALSVTAKLIAVHFICKPEEETFSHKYEVQTKAPGGCCGYSDNNISWYQMVQWAFYVAGNELSVILAILYWSLLYSPDIPVDGINANTHLVNAIIALVDLWICSIPVYTLHVVYTMGFAAVYAVFTGIYFGASNGLFVYGVIDYGDNTGFAVGLIFLTVLVVVPVVHFIVIYPLSKLKELVLYCLFKKQDATAATEDNDYNLMEVPQNKN